MRRCPPPFIGFGGGRLPTMQTPSTSNWVVPERSDLLEVISAKVLEQADGPVAADAQPDDPNPPPLSAPPLRSLLVLQKVVMSVRSAIRNAGHTPLSVVPNAVPPDAYDHVLNMAAWQIVTSTPNIQMVVITEKGAYSPLGELNKESKEWMNTIPKHAIVPPTDPTGRDWTTAVTWPPDADLYTQDELDALDYNWDTFCNMGYTRAEWMAMTNPPIPGTVRSTSVFPPVNMKSSDYGPGNFPGDVREVLGTP